MGGERMKKYIYDIMFDWNSEQKVKEVLTYFYIDGILYSPSSMVTSGV